ncbi:hypothetical protein A3A25_03060 [Candidatus Azambacteria bacterium RIFCSPLOWO2_01_FULL_46_26]|uniref:Carbohydrate kinase PfkB domain-containing protein n=1 Tax=Candidatus Azambacteria bacterium RIFCSPLOWO2_01_FULL_46_26 TaxID=1797299 RepID=A0A1F5C946_9BACT|nr:MAG: hypothetical protein A3A25_03060 [Candidatus Azambacteria bacterium RIFCSPLOWO2_01_FULL_46_26]
MDVITIGTATRDCFLQSPDFKVIRSSRFVTGQAECFALGSKIEVPFIIFTTGGGAANAAVTFARQGLKAGCLAKIGKDLAGEGVMRTLDEEKAARNFLQVDKELPTAFSVILITPSGERTILVHRGASEHLEKNKIPWQKLKAKWFYLAPMAGDNVKLIKLFVDSARRQKAKIAMNPHSTFIKLGLKKTADILNKIDVLILNREEGAKLTGIDYKEEKKIFAALDKVINGIVVMTEGPKGAIVSDGKRIYRAGTYKEKKVVDRTGAGDAFGSGFVSGLIQTGDVEYAISLGSANGTSVVEHIGAQPGILTKVQFRKRFKKLKMEKIPIK